MRPRRAEPCRLKVCITADHDVTPLYYLPVYAALSVRDGMDELEGLKAVTINPAEVLGIDDRKGSLTAGKDADIVVWDQHPFAISPCGAGIPVRKGHVLIHSNIPF